MIIQYIPYSSFVLERIKEVSLVSSKHGVTAVVLACAVLAACSAIPPKSQLVTHDPLLDRDGGVLLIADVCIQQDALGDADDYFVITEAKAGAQALLDASHKYLADNGIPVRAELVPFVCGALHDANNSLQKVADRVNGTVRDSQKPFGVSDEIKADLEYVNALSKASTYMFQYAVLSGEGANTGSNKSSGQPAPQFVSADEFKMAVAMIAAKTHASSVLFFGVAGTSISSGKAAAQAIEAVSVGMGTAIATASLGMGYYVIFLPGLQFSGRLMGGALVNLESGQLIWSNTVRAGGDPMKPEVVASADALNLLLRNLLYEPASTLPQH